jgi:HEAT repeat protein
VSVNKRILSYHLSRLEDHSPEVRLKAIEQLALLGDPEALDALQHIYQSDDDRAVRKAAQEAGRAIFLKSKRSL